jgi:hypothetical protein
MGPHLLLAGSNATANVTWGLSWCGDPAGSRALIAYGGSEWTASVSGPSQPDCVPEIRGTASAIVAMWFSGLV